MILIHKMKLKLLRRHTRNKTIQKDEYVHKKGQIPKRDTDVQQLLCACLRKNPLVFISSDGCAAVLCQAR